MKMQKFNVGDLVCFGKRRDDFPYTIIHIHQAPGDERCWFVCAYKGDIPYIKKAHELTLHTAANPPVEEGLLRDLNNKYGDWKLGQPSRDLPWENLQVSRGPDGEIVAYRVKVEPKVETKTLYGRNDPYWSDCKIEEDTHKITFTTIDGEPDCSSVKMEKL